MMRALTASDLTVMANEPRVRDLDLADRLGMANPHDIRRLIRKNQPELEMHGPFSTASRMVRIGSGARRSVNEYWLNEPQAVLVCMFSRTPKAAEVRRQVVGVFLAWRHGELAPAAPAAPPVSAEGDPWALMERRLAVLESAIGFVEHASLAEAITHLPIWRTGRRPRWWRDREVRDFVVANHRKMIIDEAVLIMRDRFSAPCPAAPAGPRSRSSARWSTPSTSGWTATRAAARRTRCSNSDWRSTRCGPIWRTPAFRAGSDAMTARTVKAGAAR